MQKNSYQSPPQVNGLEKFNLQQSLDTVTNELLNAQRELSITHEFAELQAYINRNIISSYVEMMNEVLIKSFMGTYREMITIENEVLAALDGMSPSDCLNTVRTRFNLQVSRHGIFLTRCMRNSRNEIQTWIDLTNDLHLTAHDTTNQAQNQGLASLSERSRIDSTESFHPPINRRLRNLLTSVRQQMDDFETFRASLVAEEEEIIQELTEV